MYTLHANFITAYKEFTWLSFSSLFSKAIFLRLIVRITRSGSRELCEARSRNSGFCLDVSEHRVA